MTDQEIHTLANYHFTGGNNLTVGQCLRFARAIEAAATAPLLERIAELADDVERFRINALNEKASRQELEQLAARGADGLMKASQTIAALEAAVNQAREDAQADMAEALINDCENGVKLLNEKAIEDFKKSFPRLNSAIESLKGKP